jgi:arginase family enzyme
VTKGGATYVTFDVDSLDPAFAPGTVLRGCLGLDVVGGDVFEVAPQYDPKTNTAQIAAQGLFVVLCLAAAARQARGAQIPTH